MPEIGDIEELPVELWSIVDIYRFRWDGVQWKFIEKITKNKNEETNQNDASPASLDILI